MEKYVDNIITVMGKALILSGGESAQSIVDAMNGAIQNIVTRINELIMDLQVLNHITYTTIPSDVVNEILEAKDYDFEELMKFVIDVYWLFAKAGRGRFMVKYHFYMDKVQEAQEAKKPRKIINKLVRIAREWLRKYEIAPALWKLHIETIQAFMTPAEAVDATQSMSVVKNVSLAFKNIQASLKEDFAHIQTVIREVEAFNGLPVVKIAIAGFEIKLPLSAADQVRKKEMEKKALYLDKFDKDLDFLRKHHAKILES